MTWSSLWQWRRKLAAMAAVALVLPWLHACTTNPATGESEFTPLMSPEDEVRIGAQEHKKILAQFGGTYKDKKIQQYVDRLGQKLAAASELPQLKWTFTVLDSDIINAFALPGGYVYISRGLLGLADSEDQLAGVVGHEIGHVTARHAANRYNAAVGAQIGVIGAAILTDILLGGGGQAIAQTGGAAAQGYLAGYGRGQELQSDALGVRYLDRTGYDTLAMAGFLDKMGQESNLLAKLLNQAPRGFSYLDTHPPTGERVRKATELANETPGRGAAGPPKDFYNQISGLIYGDSPAQGFRRGRNFVHPGLRLAFKVPPNFHMLNFPDKVLARGPDGTQIVFDGAPKKYSGNAAQYLTSQWAPKLNLQNVQRLRVNGLDAATAYKTLKGSRGSVGLRLGVIRWADGRMFRFQFTVPPNKASQYDPGFQDTLRSLRKISSREAGRYKPLRIRPYRVRRGDTVARLASRLPFSKLAEERFRVLNGLVDGEQVKAGQWVKMVSTR